VASLCLLARDDQCSVRLETVDNCVALALILQVRIPSPGADGPTQVAADGRGLGRADGRAAEAALAALERFDQTSAAAAAGGLSSGGLSDGLTLRERLVGRVFGCALGACSDPSWRVRWSAVSSMDQLLDALGPNPRLVKAYEALLKDPEPEVRTAAAAQVAKVAHQLGFPAAHSALPSPLLAAPPPPPPSSAPSSSAGGWNPLAESVLPAACALADDPSNLVRSALASATAGLAPVLGRDATIARLLPLLLKLLRDTDSEVRLGLVSQLGEVSQVVGVDLLAQSLLPTILELASDAKWRVRAAIIAKMPHLARDLGAAFFGEKLVGQCVAWLRDDVHSIRLAAARNLEALARLFGPPWAAQCLLPQLTHMAERDLSASSLGRVPEIEATPSSPAPSMDRMMALLALEALAPALGPDLCAKRVLPPVLLLAQDPVPNIRFTAAKALARLAPLLAPQQPGGQASNASAAACALVRSEVEPRLVAMRDGDSDRDVKYFARQALVAIHATGLASGHAC